MSHALPSVPTALRASLARRGSAAIRTLALAPTLAMLAVACSDVASAPRAADPASGEIANLPAGVTAAEVKSHVIAPRHLDGVQTEDNDATREVQFRAPWLERRGAAISADVTPTTSADLATVNLGAMGLAIHKALKDSVTGYMLQVRQNGVLVHVGQWNWSQTPSNAATGWNENTRMHVASVSKYLTAVGLVKALNAKGISYDAKIIDYLPTYWSKGSNVGQITFRQLMQHTSGFMGYGSASDFSTMKGAVAAGVPAAAIGTGNYQNLNFGLMRILIPIINGTMSKNAVFNWPLSNDGTWDASTVSQFRTYMQNAVFTPAGVANVGFSPGAGARALAYKAAFALNQEGGWDSGDLASVSGGAGFRLSPKELLNVMDHVRRRNTIIPAATAQYMLDNFFGIDQKINTAAGPLYNKNGLWRNGGTYSKTEQSVAYFLPNGMELALFVNSPIGVTGFSLRGLVADAFKASLN